MDNFKYRKANIDDLNDMAILVAKNLDDLCTFLIEAKKQTYANEKVKKILSTRKGSYDYEYSNGIMTYHDTYFGGTNFMGEEIVYLSNETPIWGMNYYGVTLDESLS